VHCLLLTLEQRIQYCTDAQVSATSADSQCSFVPQEEEEEEEEEEGIRVMSP